MHAIRPLETESETLDLDALNAEVEGADAEEVVRWAHARFGRGLIATTSFGATAAVMLHLVHRAAPRLPIVCIDTGYLFLETYRFADELTRRFLLDVRWYSPEMTTARKEALFGHRWDHGVECVKQYLRMNKFEPMQRALAELGAAAWITGLRADQTEHRSALRRVDEQDGRIKIHPLLDWSETDVVAYMEAHDLPFHPLYEQGYRSIGDFHSTLPTTPDMDPRDGRILGKSRECGIHLPLTEGQKQSLKSSGL
jgi:phosphoadenosine phosphosulfate reductase